MRALVFALSLIVGCQQEIQIDDPDGSSPPWDAGSGLTFVSPTGRCVESAGVDLLLVIDNSNSMTEEQSSLASQLPLMISRLVEPPDDDGDGQLDWLAVTDLQIAIVTTDMGTSGFTIPTCARSEFGDDAVFRSRGNVARTGCMATYPSFFRFDPRAGGRADELAADVACVAQAGTGGCGIEQPLEAALKALTPSSSPVRFFRDSVGHGDGINEGFVRENTLLAIIVLSDEEDCSVLDPNLLDPSAPTDLNLRCFENPGALHPIDRYVEGLSALRPGRPDLLALGLIVGIPPDLAVAMPRDTHYQRILADPRMQEQLDPDMPNRLIPSCNVVGTGLAFPPRRIVELGRRLGPERTSVQSLCSADFTPVAVSLSRLVGLRACETYEE